MKLYQKTATGTDSFNAPVYSETMVEVANVLVAPESSSEVPDRTDLASKKLRYTLGIPKGDNHTWEGSRVEFFGESFTVITKPVQGIDEIIPLHWNRKVTVEKIE